MDLSERERERLKVIYLLTQSLKVYQIESIAWFRHESEGTEYYSPIAKWWREKVRTEGLVWQAALSSLFAEFHLPPVVWHIPKWPHYILKNTLSHFVVFLIVLNFWSEFGVYQTKYY